MPTSHTVSRYHCPSLFTTTSYPTFHSLYLLAARHDPSTASSATNPIKPMMFYLVVSSGVVFVTSTVLVVTADRVCVVVIVELSIEK